MSELWIPGRDIELHHEYPVPPVEELANYWHEYTGGDVREAPGVYGAIAMPDAPPRAYASIDVCEILRESHLGLRSVAEIRSEPYDGNIHRYGDGTPITSAADITSVLQVLMTNGLIRPTPGVEEMASTMRRWREQGVYIVANTSTLPGCERGTIDFFGAYLPGVFDGLLLPRNHDGTLPLTKGHAAANVVAALPPEAGQDVVALHIDDSPHHNIAFRAQVGAFAGAQVATFQPQYPSHLPLDQGSVITPTPLEAFRAADAFLASQLAR